MTNTTNRTHYVVGLAFGPGAQTILLIEKKRPSWQRGKLNGPGGHVEDGESHFEAVSREFREETGLEIPIERWRHTVQLFSGDDAIISFLACEAPISEARSMTDEIVNIVSVRRLPEIENIMGNLAWIVPLSLDPQTMPGMAIRFPVIVRESQPLKQADFYISRR